MKKYLIIFGLIIVFATVMYTSYSQKKPNKTNSQKASGALIKHLKIDPEIIDRETRVPIILYHYVRDIAPQPDNLGWGLSVPPSTFQQQMDYLVKENYTTITPNNLYQYLKYGTPLPPKPIMLTFDDGYLDFFEEVFPVLRDNHLTATNFIISNFLGREQYLDWYHLKYMVASGRVFVGGHTLNHMKLTEVNSEQLDQEIAINKASLEEGLDTKIDYFAYPYGSYDDNVLNALKKNKYKAAFTTENGNIHKTSQLLKLPRIKVGGGDTVQTFAEKIKTE
ncbi:MAG: polysaccharide deacetylase family protein [Patescibacteria group bacterium]|nr:polysaccharide deacetylase family protein [Patescibacteria group bacterium]